MTDRLFKLMLQPIKIEVLASWKDLRNRKPNSAYSQLGPFCHGGEHFIHVRDTRTTPADQ